MANQFDEYQIKLKEVINSCAENSCNISDVCEECSMKLERRGEYYYRTYTLPATLSEEDTLAVLSEASKEAIKKACSGIGYSSCDEIVFVVYDKISKAFKVRVKELD